MKIKICGLTRPCDIEMINAARPDYAGFVFAESRRRVAPEAAAELTARLAPGILPVGVFVNEEIESILKMIRHGVRLDLIQLHGSEDEDYIVKIKTLTGKPVIKAVSVSTKGDIEKWAGSAADYLLLDSKGGGTGKRFDWDVIGEVSKPFFLAGGLTSENILEAQEKIKPFAVDVSSGVETDGYKDEAKVKDFIRKVKNFRRF